MGATLVSAQAATGKVERQTGTVQGRRAGARPSESDALGHMYDDGFILGLRLYAVVSTAYAVYEAVASAAPEVTGKMARDGRARTRWGLRDGRTCNSGLGPSGSLTPPGPWPHGMCDLKGTLVSFPPSMHLAEQWEKLQRSLSGKRDWEARYWPRHRHSRHSSRASAGLQTPQTRLFGPCFLGKMQPRGFQEESSQLSWRDPVQMDHTKHKGPVCWPADLIPASVWDPWLSGTRSSLLQALSLHSGAVLHVPRWREACFQGTHRPCRC